MTDTNLVRFRAAVAGALAHLESRRQEVNDLNVFPVADGDTGDNMALTLRAVLAELDRLQGADEHRTIDEIGRDEIVQSVARAALLGARGNSGVILSQLIRGAAEELVSRPGQLIDATLIGAALANAADRAYSSVRDPAEGTILTVAREMAHKIVADLAHLPETRASGPPPRRASRTRRSPPRSNAPSRQGRTRSSAVPSCSPRCARQASSTPAAMASRSSSPASSPRCAGRSRRRSTITPPRASPTPSTPQGPTASAPTSPSSAVASAPRASSPRSRSSATRCSSSAIETTLKVHLHTDSPELATAVFADAGEVSHLDVADMRAQVAERDGRLTAEPHAGGDDHAHAIASTVDADGAGAPAEIRCAAVAVVSGEGLRALFNELGVRTIDGGPTLNPSTYDLLAGIHEVPAEEVVLLTNSANVIMAAEHAARLSEKDVHVAATTSQQAGLAAAVALAQNRSVEENAQAISEALQRLRTGAVAQAARDDAQGRFKRGDAVGFIEEQVCAWGDPRETLRSILATLAEGDNGQGPPELISVLDGEHAPFELAEIEGMVNGGVELELRHGGQAAYWWLLAAE